MSEIRVPLSISVSEQVFPLEITEPKTVELGVEVAIVAADIPSNYGLITWDGSTLTVS